MKLIYKFCLQWAIAALLLFQLQLTSSAKILFFMGLSSYSHRIALQPLANRLADLGHEVTFVSPIQIRSGNQKITEFCPTLLSSMNQELVEEQGKEAILGRLEDRHYNPFFDTKELWNLLYNFGAAVVSSPDFGQWMNNSNFDLVITEHPSKEVAFGIAYKFRAKIITFVPSPHLMMEADMFGLPIETSWLPDITLGSNTYYNKLIPERFAYAFNSIYFYLSYTRQYLPRLDVLLKENLGEGIPPLEQLIRNTSIYFTNLHFSNEYARSLPPFVVPVGGMHITESHGILPKEIEEFVRGNETKGFIYVSFGSIMKISALPNKTLQIFFDSMASFKNVLFIWKWDDVKNNSFIGNLPPNVVTRKWLPQQEILAHPKCKGFICQGGLMSFQQASYYGVPLIIIPVFWDQPYNARVGVHHGTAIHLELSDISLTTMKDAINNILYNNFYSKNAQEMSRRFRDRPMSALDTAVWWTEYVLRHNDTSHLKPLGIHQYWWQRRLLDVWAVVFFVVLIFLLILVLICCASYTAIRFFVSQFNRCEFKMKKS